MKDNLPEFGPIWAPGPNTHLNLSHNQKVYLLTAFLLCWDHFENVDKIWTTFWTPITLAPIGVDTSFEWQIKGPLWGLCGHI